MPRQSHQPSAQHFGSSQFQLRRLHRNLQTSLRWNRQRNYLSASMKGVKIYTCRKIRREVEEQLAENHYQPPPPASPRDEDGFKLRVIFQWKWLFQKHLLTDHASEILHILSRMDEMQNRMVREKEERQKLLEMRRKPRRARPRSLQRKPRD